MNQDTKTLVYVALAAAAVGAGYWYLQKSGLWAQWFGGAIASSFTDPQALLAFCQANPNSQATYTDANGKTYTYYCWQWLAENTGPVMNLPNASPVDPDLLASLQAAAIANPAMGSDQGNVAQFNLLLQGIDPNAELTDLNADPTQMMNSQQYLLLRAQVGLSGLAPQQTSSQSPYAWVN